MNNKVIILEGGDASGKTTQAKLLVEREGYVELRLPEYSFKSGELIKEWNENEKIGISEAAYQALQITNYVELLYNSILPMLREGKKIVITRFTPSMKVYSDIFTEDLEEKSQEAHREMIGKMIDAVEDLYSMEGAHFQKIFINISSEEAERRIDHRDKTTDQKREPVFESPEMVKKVNTKYNELNKMGPIEVVDGEQKIDTVYGEILNRINHV